MPRRRVPNRDEFLRYMRAQRQGRAHRRSTLPGIQLSRLINTAPTRVILPDRQSLTQAGDFRGTPVGDVRRLRKQRRRRRFSGQPVGSVTPIRRTVSGQPVGQVRPLR